MSEERQLGLMFEMEQGRTVETSLTAEDFEVADPPEFEPEQPALFADIAAPVRENPEPEIPWTEYIRMVQMFFDQLRFEEFQGKVSRLAVKYGTKNLTDTVAEAVRREAI